jgi:hypothetical protein
MNEELKEMIEEFIDQYTGWLEEKADELKEEEVKLKRQKEMSLDDEFKNAPGWARWITQSRHGNIAAWSHMPEENLATGFWASKGGKMVILKQLPVSSQAKIVRRVEDYSKSDGPIWQMAYNMGHEDACEDSQNQPEEYFVKKAHIEAYWRGYRDYLDEQDEIEGERQDAEDWRQHEDDVRFQMAGIQ